mmetsp:Transcript_28029/g.77108  ORF Transcript_28029/g.77108 Transcript_28029/m.77108 type:complete len:218 (+) Transcript_28029:224-877(+)
MASRPASCADGMGPRSSRMPRIWPSKRSKRVPSTRPRQRTTRGSRAFAASTSISWTSSSTNSNVAMVRPSSLLPVAPMKRTCLLPWSSHSLGPAFETLATTPCCSSAPCHAPKTPASPRSTRCSKSGSSDRKRNRWPGSMASSMTTGSSGRRRASSTRRCRAARSSSLGSLRAASPPPSASASGAAARHVLAATAASGALNDAPATSLQRAPRPSPW